MPTTPQPAPTPAHTVPPRTCEGRRGRRVHRRIRRVHRLAALALPAILASVVVFAQGSTAPEPAPVSAEPTASATGSPVELESSPGSPPLPVTGSAVRSELPPETAAGSPGEPERPPGTGSGAPAVASSPGAEIGLAEATVGVRGPGGRPLAGLSPDDLRVVEGGEEGQVLEVRPEGRPWRLVIYLDPVMAAPRTPPRALRALETLARELTELGSVEVVLAEDAPRRILAPTRDPLELTAVLARTAFSTPGEDRLVALRREALVEVQMAGPADAGGESAAEARRAAATAAAEREAELVWERLDALLGYLAEPPPEGPATEGGGPSALLWVGDGFDLDPTAFWRRDARARSSLQGRALLGPATEEADTGEADTGEADSGEADSGEAAGGEAPGGETAGAETDGGETDGGETDRGEADGGETGTGETDPGEPASPGAAGDLPVALAATAGAAAGLPRLHRATLRAAAALGWTVVPIALRGDAEAVPFEPAPPLGVEGEVPEAPPRPRVEGQPGGGATVLLPHRRTAEQRAREALAREAGPPPVPLAPEAALVPFAEASGGRLVETVAQLPELLSDLRSRYRVRYTTTRGGGAGADADALRRLEVRATAPAAERVEAPAWVADGTPPAVSELRARRLLAGELDPGTLTVRAAVGVGARPAGDGPAAGDLEARVEVRVEGAPGESPPAPGPRRLTLAALPEEGGPPTVVRRRVDGRLLSAGAAGAGSVATWVHSGDVRLPPTTERVAVVVEDPETGRWGGTVAGLLDTVRGAGAWDAEAGLLPGPKTVNLLRPEGDVLTGDQLFETVVDPAVAAVELRLDGRRRERVEAPPFRAVLDLGRLPLRRVVEAVAFGAGGEELGRDSLVVNGGGGRLRVRILEPEGPRAVGPVDVTIDLRMPEDATLDRLDLFWRDRLVASLFQPPFRQRLVIPAAAGDATVPPGATPPAGAEGFLRAVARLTDGTQAEDVRYLNGPLAAERVDVRLTELYVVVTDRAGRPVRGLEAADFEVREDGRRQAVETFSAAGDLPITVGLAIDSSASMFVKLKEVQAAAAEFLGRLTPGRDRAFLVDFDDEVRLAATTTRDLDRVARAGQALVADGRTSLWQAVVYALVQLQGAPGRKALVVYSDGADEDEDFSFRTALAFARKVGVPIYVIVSNDEAVRTGGIPIGFPSLGGRLERLTREVGGRVWLVRRNDDLSAIYRQIQEELSAQYLLGYYPEREGAGDWRRVEVEMRRRGLKARTLSGYER